MPSARRSRRISAQSSTPNTPLPPQLDNEPGSSRVVSFRLPEGGQFSRAVDTVEREIDATLARQPVPVGLGSYLPHSSGKAARPPSTLAAETA
jgi:hypothetical protein